MSQGSLAVRVAQTAPIARRPHGRNGCCGALATALEELDEADIARLAPFSLSRRPLAADLAARPYKAPPAPVSAAYNWSGFYVGLNAGGAGGDDPVTYTPLYSGAPAAFPAVAAANGSPIFHPAGVTAGGQAGYNWQASQFVLGIEADIEYLDLKSAFTTPVLTFPGVTDYFSRPRSGLTGWRRFVPASAWRWIVSFCM